MSNFEKFVVSLREQWRVSRAEHGLTFQEFLLALFIYHTQEKDNG